ncbi:MAG: tRNA (N6-threonylcarbamoyladenosine(37)-N6)-methyltransferase TrmO [Elusimicrobiota bacterium]|jgi:tRNA-Thr(GGU) m(6)t(6)A37 methyltransferase TsaA
MRLRSIGKIRNSVKSRKGMTNAGAPSRILLERRYLRALEGLRPGMHLWALCWLHKADRAVLRAAPRRICADLPERGVFSTRSPDRPNPIALTICRLLAVRGCALEVDRLDVVDGTPLLDLKPYAPGIDCIPSAYTRDFSGKYHLAEDAFLRTTLRRIVENHCSGLSREGRAAAELVLRWIRTAKQAPSARALGGAVLKTNLGPQGADALYALFGLRPSSQAVRFGRKPEGPPYWIEDKKNGRIEE